MDTTTVKKHLLEMYRHQIETADTRSVITGIIAGLLVGLVIHFLFRIPAVIKVGTQITNDTLKRDGKWDPTRLTMFGAFLSIVWAFHFDTVKNMKVNEELFLIMGCIATGVGIARAYSKKLNPDAPKPEGGTDEQKS